jgi:protein disulfide-isomerase A1
MLLTFVDGAFERKEISGFLSANKLPLVVTFSPETASAIFEDEVSRQVRAVILSAHHLV